MSDIIVPNALECQAILRSINSKAAKSTRADIEEGRHLVDFRAHFKGVIDVGADYTQKVAPSYPWEHIALSAFERLTDAEKGEVIEKAGEGEGLELLRAKHSRWVEPMKKATTRICQGKVSAKLIVSKL